jgi:23S rRNA (adenine2030-N6)-methyltransferase
MVWYPLLPDARHAPLADGLTALGIAATWRGELEWSAPSQGAHGTGQVILNMPYGLDAEADALLDWLGPVLAATPESWRVASGLTVPPR